MKYKVWLALNITDHIKHRIISTDTKELLSNFIVSYFWLRQPFSANQELIRNSIYWERKSVKQNPIVYLLCIYAIGIVYLITCFSSQFKVSSRSPSPNVSIKMSKEHNEKTDPQSNTQTGRAIFPANLLVEFLCLLWEVTHKQQLLTLQDHPRQLLLSDN